MPMSTAGRIYDSSQSFWPLNRIGGIFLYEENGEIVNMEAARERMIILLEQMRDRGVELFVDGEAALPGEAAAKSVREDSPYMADYVFGDAGNIEQVRFDKVVHR